MRELFNLSIYSNESDRYRARVIYIILGMMLLFWTIYVVTVPDWSVPQETALLTLLEVGLSYPATQPGIIFYVIYLIPVIAFIANRQGYKSIAGFALAFGWFASGVALNAVTSTSPSSPGGGAMMLFVMSVFVMGPRALFVSYISCLFLIILRDLSSTIYDTATSSVEAVLIQYTAAAILIYLFYSYANVIRREGVEQAVQGRDIAGSVISNIAQQVARRSTLDKLLGEVVNEINDQFEYVYHTQVFLIDDRGQEARLVASTGEVGRKLIQRAHSLPVGSTSVIGQVTLTGSPVIAQSGSANTVHKRNELLPETQVEAAFPLRLGDRIIGALDVQSKQRDAFDDPILTSTFLSLADGVTLAIDNVRQFELAQERDRENTRLVDEMQDTLDEVERLNDRLTGLAWSEYLRTHRRDMGLAIDFEHNDMQTEADWTPALLQSIKDNHLVQMADNGAQFIAVPLRVRGRVVGAMEFELDQEQGFSPEEFDLVQEVSERFGMAVENARLVDESQRNAQREALVNQISSRLQAAKNVEELLNEAARNLQTTLKANRVSIRLGSPEKETV